MQIVATALLLAWFVVAATAPMMLGAPGASNRLRSLLTIFVIVSYPVLIGLVFLSLGWNLWFVSPRGVFFATLAAPAIALFFLGRQIVNLLRGIANEGYTIKETAVYASGKEIVGADPRTFQPLDSNYAKDNQRVYRYVGLGEVVVIKGADPTSFEVMRQRGGAAPQDYDARDKFRRYMAGNPIVGLAS